ncbi:DsrE family protein [Halohasta litorea]|uniref:DsrE family protein n=1 Tax=Halohasta litorea TaxID=869891 RepID=A0ABD6D988_9EURY|nr:DsrE family protein [Halohasta litorea]MEA1932114.1 DsrE family protein [Euryarchaeota archaeon]
MSTQQGTVVHISTDEVSKWQMALRNLQNLVGDESVPTPPEALEVVITGPGVQFLLESSPEAYKIRKMVEAGVTVAACSNSLSRFGHDPEAVVDGVSIVHSGVAEVVRVQQGGTDYLKLP